MPDSVILVHGVWMTGLEMLLLRRALVKSGYEVETVPYSSLVRTPESTQARLAEKARERASGERASGELASGQVHWVAHSLGGLLVCSALDRYGDLPAGRVVCLGSPLSGSATARSMRKPPWFGWWLGASAGLLEQGIQRLPQGREVGMIAGDVPHGVGSLITSLEEPHDGAVEVAETRMQGLADHRVVHQSHTGLVLSSGVAELTAGFLRTGCFVDRT